MNILIPMAGEGVRFINEGYRVSKPAIPTYDRRDGVLKPMVVCATLDLPYILDESTKLIYVDRLFHKTDKTEDKIINYFPKSTFISLDSLTEGQACTCLMAEQYINNSEELLIAGCDNGMEYDLQKFEKMRQKADVLVFTYRNNECVLECPDSYGWMMVGENDSIIDISIKKTISDNPLKDHAVVATFWFKKGSIFVEAAKKMISQNDRINDEFYVDQVIKYTLQMGLNVKVFEINRYIGWGTPKDYENYQKTFEYWRAFSSTEGLFK